MSEIVSKFRTDIFEKQRKKSDIGNWSLSPVEVDTALVNEAKDFFHGKFNLNQNSYQMFLAIRSDSNQLLCVKGFEFILFEHNIESIELSTDDYKYGYGVTGPHVNPGATIFLRINPIDDERKVQRLYRDCIRS